MVFINGVVVMFVHPSNKTLTPKFLQEDWMGSKHLSVKALT
jgi:hypothetical protein